MKKIAVRVPVMQVIRQKDDGTLEEVDVNNLDSHWIIFNLENGNVKLVRGDKDPIP